MTDRLVNVRRRNPWYGRTQQSLDGDWVLRAGWWYWIVRGQEAET